VRDSAAWIAHNYGVAVQATEGKEGTISIVTSKTVYVSYKSESGANCYKASPHNCEKVKGVVDGEVTW